MDQNPTLELEPPRFERSKAFLIAGLKGHYQANQTQAIPAQWQRFVPYLGTLPGQVGRKAYGVCYNSDETGSFDYLCGVEVASPVGLPPELSSVSIPEQHYAVFAHRGPLSRLGETFAAIWNQWLPGSGHQAAESPSLEVYPEEFDPQTNPAGVEIWLPIKASTHDARP
ncbi:MAG: AraC family transcriptional regulator [Verrucomicrobia bacterium]|nr:AraC family transcriptional regulator [Verrucomicrobiota bacterium]